VDNFIFTLNYETKISSSPQLRGGLRRGGVLDKINTSPGPSSSEEGRQMRFHNSRYFSNPPKQFIE